MLPLLKTLVVDASGLLYADYARAPARSPLTPLQQLLRHVERLVGQAVRCTEVALSRELLAELERRTEAFAALYAPPALAKQFMARWRIESRPAVGLRLKPGEVEVQLEFQVDGRRRPRSEPVPQGEER